MRTACQQLLAVLALFATISTSSVAVAQPTLLPPQQPGFLGLVVEASSTGPGLKIVELTPGGPAEQGGLKVGDRLMIIGTVAINRPADLARALGGQPAGTNLKIRFERAGIEGEAPITLGTAPRGYGTPATAPGLLPGQAIPLLPRDATDDGILLGVKTVVPRLRDLLRIKAPGQFTRGALVKEVYAGTPAAKAGLQVDSLIYAVDGNDVISPTDLIRRIKRAGDGNEVTLSVFRAGNDEKIKVRLAEARDTKKRPLAPRLPPQAPAGTVPGNASTDADLEARLGALERRMTMIEQRLIDLQRTLDAMRQQR